MKLQVEILQIMMISYVPPKNKMLKNYTKHTLKECRNSLYYFLKNFKHKQVKDPYVFYFKCVSIYARVCICSQNPEVALDTWSWSCMQLGGTCFGCWEPSSSPRSLLSDLATWMRPRWYLTVPVKN